MSNPCASDHRLEGLASIAHAALPTGVAASMLSADCAFLGAPHNRAESLRSPRKNTSAALAADPRSRPTCPNAHTARRRSSGLRQCSGMSPEPPGSWAVRNIDVHSMSGAEAHLAHPVVNEADTLVERKRVSVGHDVDSP